MLDESQQRVRVCNQRPAQDERQLDGRPAGRIKTDPPGAQLLPPRVERPTKSYVRCLHLISIQVDRSGRCQVAKGSGHPVSAHIASPVKKFAGTVPNVHRLATFQPSWRQGTEELSVTTA